MKSKKTIQLIASGDLRLSANQTCWAAQEAMEALLVEAVESEGYQVVRGHAYDKKLKHGFIASQREGMEVFRRLDPKAPLIVAEAVWQYSHHVLAGLTTHRGPILTVANWSGQWPGLVGMLNLNGSLTKAGVKYSTLWSEDFTDDFFKRKLKAWLKEGRVQHDLSHVRALNECTAPIRARSLGRSLAKQLREDKAIMGVFDEGCMGMFNAIIPDQVLHSTGVFKERMSQSSLYHEVTQTRHEEAEVVLSWLMKKGMKFHFGDDHTTLLTRAQVLLQCKMYVAALRLADDFGCDTIGIQYQQGLKDLLPASDLVEGMLNNADRPPVRSRDGKRVLFKGEPLVHFNEVDECAGLDGLMTLRVHRALGQPVESTLHDIRWGEVYGDEYVWVLLISGAAPPAHFVDGWKGADGHRQPAMYFPNGGSTLRGVSKPGEIVWSRVYVQDEGLHLDIGRGHVVELPNEETERRWQMTTPQWPIMHAVLNGVSRDQLMAKHQANHIQVAYATDANAANHCLYTKASFAQALGMKVNVCGDLG
ncbi:fucose isomerase [Phragmitibacter flavus]|uniref:Fucose isomerase n=1 Tax=Phragmitibacter flavus TaxID=2576071 RepID=A0A5R8KCA0_9BACT|nr:fucose isomerase [Phragmitibacter flavus]TLD69932.1 fucose isomerase [Phragmitibacter flavus]